MNTHVTDSTNNSPKATAPGLQYDGKQLKRKALTPLENYIANVVWTFFGLTFFFMAIIAFIQYHKFALESWEQFTEVWILGTYGGLIITAVLIYYFSYKDKQKEKQKMQTVMEKMQNHS